MTHFQLFLALSRGNGKRPIPLPDLVHFQTLIPGRCMSKYHSKHAFTNSKVPKMLKKIGKY